MNNILKFHDREVNKNTNLRIWKFKDLFLQCKMYMVGLRAFKSSFINACRVKSNPQYFN